MSRYALSKSPCHQPDLLRLHGSFISPNYQLTTTYLFPLFSGQNIGGGINPEIRTPTPLYWKSETEFYSPDIYPQWSDKSDAVFWRGGNTGGRVNASNWEGFQRHRLVTMSNHSEIQRAVGGNGSGDRYCTAPWAMVDPSCQILGNGPTTGAARRASHVKERFDVGFNAYGCVDPDTSFTCGGRFRSFMLSNSIPIKATIFDEWHDSRLVPWKHFIPMDNRFQDIWTILDYFFGLCLTSTADGCIPHDNEAMAIGVEGGEWARRVLRKEDMVLYLLRLLLEYGRIFNR